MAAAANTYKAGQLLGVTNGLLAALTAITATTPPYLCMADKIITAADVTAGELLPVTRVSKDLIYETVLGEAVATAAPGVRLRVANGGLQATGGAPGTFEIVSLDGTAEGDVVRGRFA
jgi:hypothetical protein